MKKIEWFNLKRKEGKVSIKMQLFSHPDIMWSSWEKENCILNYYKQNMWVCVL